MAEDVALTDLEVIQRYSLAVRAASADRAELLRVLQADVAWLQRGGTRSAAGARTPAKAPAKKTTSRTRRA